jgi:two-component system, NarL family, response regulator NreC
MSIRVLLADDHGVLRDAMCRLLESQADFEVVGAACDGSDAIVKAEALAPEVIVMDVSMPKLNGIEATRRILKSSPGTGVVMLSMHSSGELVQRALAAGARGYVLKESGADDMMSAVRAVAAGGRYLGEGVDTGAMDSAAGAVLFDEPLIDCLTTKEREIVRLLVNGNSNAETAAKLRLSPRTVETYRARLMDKLHLDDLPALVKYAIRHGMTSVD